MAQRILAVDDEVDVLLIVKTALQSEGFEVETASNGPDGLAMAKDNPPDLILLDVMMPGMTGFDVPARAQTGRTDLHHPGHHVDRGFGTHHNAGGAVFGDILLHRKTV